MSRRASTDQPLTPLELTLAFTRAKNAGNPHRFSFEPQDYILTHEDNTTGNAPFPWGPEVARELDAVQRVTMAPEAAAGLGVRLRDFLSALGFAKREAEIEEAHGMHRPVHLTVRSNAAELYALPWELMPLGETGVSLGALPGCLIRYEWPGTITRAPEPDPPSEGGRILFAWSDAGGEVPSQEHLEVLRGACQDGYHPFDESRDVLAGVSLERLQKRLDEAKGVGSISVLHVLCHGGQAGSLTESYGLIWNADGEDDCRKDVIDGKSLSRVLARYAFSIRLVVLCACNSGNTGALDNHLGSVAQALHRAGIRAVVASRYPLAIDASVDLTRELYRGLLVDLLSLEDAFLAARNFLAGRAIRVDWAALQLYACEADGPDHRPVVFAPYRGLLPFEEKHARFFFGRSSEVGELLRELGALVTGNEPRFMVVAGDSGTGKSSMVLASAVPHLESEGWISQVIRPGGEPLIELETALIALFETLQRKGAGRGQALLIVDQLEELFTSSASVDARTEFARRLWDLARSPCGPGVIATLRIDFLGQCGAIVLDEKSGLRLDKVVLTNAHQVLVAQMDVKQLEETIEKPAGKAGLVLGAGLIGRILADVNQEPGALPLVQHTLRLLWERRAGRVLTQDSYDGLNGVLGALNEHADQVIKGLSTSDPEKERVARRLLVGLVQLGHGDSPNTRKRTSIAKLRPKKQEDTTRFDEVLRKLVDQRLLVRSGKEGEQTVEVAHEALIRKWAKLGEWIQKERNNLLAQEELERWVETFKKTNALLSQGQVEVTQRLVKADSEMVTNEARDLLEKSLAEIRRRTRWLRGIAAGAVMVAVIVGVLGVAAWVQRDAARTASRMAGAREFLARAQPDLASMVLAEVKDPEKARGWSQLAIDILEQRIPRYTRAHEHSVSSVAWSPDGRRIVTASYERIARVWNADGTGEPLVLEGHDGDVRFVAWSPDGTRIVTTSDDRTARVWSADGKGNPLALKGHTDTVNFAVWSPDSKRIVTASRDATARVWTADSVGSSFVFKGHSKVIMSARWSPDSRRIVTASEDGTAQVWNADGSDRPVILRGHEGTVCYYGSWSSDGKQIRTMSSDHSARIWSADGTGDRLVPTGEDSIWSTAWSPDGTRIVGVFVNNAVRVWNTDGTSDPVVLKGDARGVSSMAWNPDNKHIVVVADGIARVFNADGTGDPLVFRNHAGTINDAAWSLDGTRIVTTGTNTMVNTGGNAQVWDTGGTVILTGHEARVASAAWSPDGKRIVTASDDTTARVSNADGTGDPLVLRGHASPVVSAAWSPDGKHIVTASEDSTARVWSADEAGDPLILKGHVDAVRSAAWSPDGKRIVTGSDDKTARIWNADGAGAPLVLKGHESFVYFVAWSPDGTRIVTTSEDGTARVWNADGTGRPLVIKGHDNTIGSAAWSPDGKRIVMAVTGKGSAQVWNADGTGAPFVFEANAGTVWSAAWSPDGKRIVTTYEDGTARIWSADGAGDPLVVKGHQGVVWSVRWSPDGKRIVTSSDDMTARVWTVIPDLKQALRGATTDCLLPDQRQNYLTESESDARAAYEACERSHDRTPHPTATP